MSNEKNYIAGTWIYEVNFSNGGSLLNLNMNLEEFYEQAKKIVDEKGFVKLNIAKRKNIEEKKPTHYCYENKFNPK